MAKSAETLPEYPELYSFMFFVMDRYIQGKINKRGITKAYL